MRVFFFKYGLGFSSVVVFGCYGVAEQNQLGNMLEKLCIVYTISVVTYNIDYVHLIHFIVQ